MTQYVIVFLVQVHLCLSESAYLLARKAYLRWLVTVQTLLIMIAVRESMY
jgi:hypothetical protein